MMERTAFEKVVVLNGVVRIQPILDTATSLFFSNNNQYIGNGRKFKFVI